MTGEIATRVAGACLLAAVVQLALPESDSAIVAALRAGERAGGTALYDRHARYVRRVLVRVLGPDTEVRDLIQDVFVLAIDSIESLQEPSALRAWLAGISVHRARAEIRRKVRSRWFSLYPSNEPPAVEAPSQVRRSMTPTEVRARVAVRLTEAGWLSREPGRVAYSRGEGARAARTID